MTVINTPSLPFFVKAQEPTELEGEVPFFVFGSSGGSSGVFNSLPFFLEGEQVPSLAINFFVQVSDLGSGEADIPFYAAGGPGRINGQVPFYALGPSGVEESITFYTRGLGVTDGAYPIEQAINFFIRRPASAFLPFYVLAPGNPIESGIPFYTAGAEQVSDNIEFAVPEVVGHEQEQVTFFTRGF